MKSVKNSAGILLLSLLIFSPLLPARSHSNPKLMIQDSQERYNLGRHLEFIEDKDGTLTIDEVSSPGPLGWPKSDSDVPSFGYSQSIFWFRLTLEGLSQDKTWLTEIDYPPLDQVSLLYRSAQGSWVKKTSGDDVKFSSRELFFRNPTFLLPQNDQLTIYLRRIGKTNQEIRISDFYDYYIMA